MVGLAKAASITGPAALWRCSGTITFWPGPSSRRLMTHTSTRAGTIRRGAGPERRPDYDPFGGSADFRSLGSGSTAGRESLTRTNGAGRSATFSDHARLGEHRLPHLQFALREDHRTGGRCRPEPVRNLRLDGAETREARPVVGAHRQFRTDRGASTCAASRRFPDRGMCGRCEGSTSEPGSAAALRSGRGLVCCGCAVVRWPDRAGDDQPARLESARGSGELSGCHRRAGVTCSSSSSRTSQVISSPEASPSPRWPSSPPSPSAPARVPRRPVQTPGPPSHTSATPASASSSASARSTCGATTTPGNGVPAPAWVPER